jgi:phosphoglycerate dehydrogenase-like enzyme
MIVLHARPSPGFRAAVDAVFGAGVVVHVDEAEALDGVADAITVLLHVLTPVTPPFIASAPKLRLIQKLGVGVNTIALDAAREQGVAVCNMPGTNSQAVAEMALSLMLAVLRRTCFFDARTRAGKGGRPIPRNSTAWARLPGARWASPVSAIRRSGWHRCWRPLGRRWFMPRAPARCALCLLAAGAADRGVRHRVVACR